MRTTVVKFAKAMDAILDKNSYKGGWRGETLNYLIGRLEEEVVELRNSIKAHNLNLSSPGIWAQKEALDVANFAMMIWDIIGRRKEPRL